MVEKFFGLRGVWELDFVFLFDLGDFLTSFYLNLNVCFKTGLALTLSEGFLFTESL